MTFLWSLLGFVLVMGLIVTIHEWGHYQVAKWFNIKVTTFSLGFGPSIYEKQGKETCFKVGLIPLGGYVKFVDEREGAVSAEDLPRAFNRQTVYKRFAVVAAGPLINLLFAWVVFSMMYMVGISGFKPVFNQVIDGSPLAQSLPESFVQNEQGGWSVVQMNGEQTYNWQMVHQAILKSAVNNDTSVDMMVENVVSGQQLLFPDVSLQFIDLNNAKQNWLKGLGFVPFKMPLAPILGVVVADGAADLAGLKIADRIVSVNGMPTTQWSDLVQVVKALPDSSVAVEYMRSGAIYMAQVHVGSAVDKETGQLVGKLGVGVEMQPEAVAPYLTTVQFGLFDSMTQAYQRSIDLINMSLVMLKRMIFGEVSLQNLSGPLSIAQFSGQAVQSGLIAFLSLLGLLSLSIGILNLLPIPVLDGGHLLYYLVEMIKGSPVSEQLVEVGQRIGLVLIVGLTFVALFNDVLRISHG